MYRLLITCLLLLSVSCRENVRDKSVDVAIKSSSTKSNLPKQQHDEAEFKEVPVYGFEVIKVWPHDREAFTQGLVFYEGDLLESTGQYGASSLRRINLKNGQIQNRIAVPSQYFAEGLALLNDKLFQLTWTTQKGFIYDPKSFRLIGEFRYGGEGWGLTSDGESLIMSDGTNQIRFLNSSTYEIKRTVEVFNNGEPVRNLNELEYIKGEIYANIWHSDRIVRIEPRTGKILGWIDLSGLIPQAEKNNPEAVLNGIAYDAANDRLFVTGKLWPKIFEIKLIKKSIEQ